MRKKIFAEFVGTFILVFAGTGAAVFNFYSNNAITHPGIALVFGLVVLAMAYTFGDVSGAHINPAVTIGFAVARRFAWRDVPGYIVMQCLGALAASLLLAKMFPDGKTVNFGATIPLRPDLQSQCFVLEIWLTWALMLVILHVSTGAKEKGITAGIAVGAVIALEALFAGPICGASMNPARSLAPALVAPGDAARNVLWVYIFGPMIGAILAVPTFALTRQKTSETAEESTKTVRES
jgi:aquaporin NIP